MHPGENVAVLAGCWIHHIHAQKGASSVKLRVLTVFSVAALLVAAVASIAGASGRTIKLMHRGTVKPAHAVFPDLSVLYNQNNNDGGVGLVSDNFDAAFDAYDDQAADDFVVPTGKQWQIQGVAVTGVYFNGPGPADSENVFIYKDASGLPGATVKAEQALSGTDTAGSFKILLSPPVALTTSGTYWVSVQ